MLEIKISVTTAANLLVQRMRSEFEYRKKQGMFAPGYDLNNISYNELLKITETAIYDLIILLPAEVFMKENNLALIIANAIRTLAKDLNREELVLYDVKKAQNIVDSVCRLFKKSERDKSYLNN
jgi:putative lipase involved disintegration of autophagic bodies